MGLTAAYHNALKNKPSSLEFKSLVENNNKLQTLVADEAKSLIKNNNEVDSVDLTNRQSEEQLVNNYINSLNENQKSNLLKDFLGSAVDSVVSLFNVDEPKIPTIDPETINNAATDTTFIGDDNAGTEVDPMTAKVMEYAELDDRALASKLNEVESQLAELELEANKLNAKYDHTVPDENALEEYKKAIDDISTRKSALWDERFKIVAAQTYKRESKIIEKMTPEQKAELEAINNEMTPIMEKIDEIYQKEIDATERYLDAQPKAVSGEISQEAYEAIADERETLINMLNSLYSQLAPLEEKRDALFDAVQGTPVAEAPVYTPSTKAPETPATSTTTTGTTTSSSENPATTEGGKHKTLADKIAENAESNSMLGVPTTSTTKTTTTKISSSTNNTNNKDGSKSNIFTKVAGKVNAETLEGVLDAMAKKGLSETFTNARKVGDQVGVDFTKRQFLSALDGKRV